jgi:toxin ParE1/3/4
MTESAHAEFTDILAYTEEERGTEQRDLYSDMFVGTVERLSRDPLLGTMRDDLKPGLRSIPMKAHVIYYSIVDDVVYVRRILHRRRRDQQLNWDET